MLRTRRLVSRPRCSKAPRGLFVLSWGTRIFTGTSISPSPLSRQCSSRYSFRAGRNLPDKEFRYLRTVIVTAAVHRGFPSWLRSPLRLTFRHWAGVSPYTSACAFAETCVFAKQSLEPVSCGPLALCQRQKATRAPLLPRVRGQFAEFLDRGSLVHLGGVPPAYRCRCAVRAELHISLAAFLGGLGVRDFRPIARTRASCHAHWDRAFPRSRTPGWQPILSIRWVHVPYRVPASLNRCVLVQESLTCLPSPTTMTSSA
jgi:hypothetical protein